LIAAFDRRHTIALVYVFGSVPFGQKVKFASAYGDLRNPCKLDAIVYDGAGLTEGAA
jgi:hypothetical protein